MEVKSRRRSRNEIPSRCLNGYFFFQGLVGRGDELTLSTSTTMYFIRASHSQDKVDLHPGEEELTAEASEHLVKKNFISNYQCCLALPLALPTYGYNLTVQCKKRISFEVEMY